MYLKLRFIIALLCLLNSFLLNAQPITNCAQGTEKSQYGFANPCSSFIKWDVTPKHLGSVFEINDTLIKNSYCVYSIPPSDNEYFDGKIEFTENVKIPIKDRKNLIVNLTPCKANRFYVKDNFEYRFNSWERDFGSYSDAEWKIENQKKAPSKVDSIFFLNNRKPTFGEYMVLLYLEFGSETDFDVPKISEYITGDKKYMRNFYEDYIGKSYDNLNRAFKGEKEDIEFTPDLITEEYQHLRGVRDPFIAISLFFDYYYKEYQKYMPSKNAEDLIVSIHDYLNPPSHSYAYKFTPQYLIDKYYGSVSFGFRNETIALEFSNPNIKDVSNKTKALSAIIRADFKYQNLPYERIVFKNEEELGLDSFYLGKGFVEIKPKSYSLDLDIFENDDYHLGYISSFHQLYERDLPPRIHSDEYIRSFMGLHIKEATLTLKIQGENYEFEYARLLIDGTEINGIVNVDFSKFRTPINKDELVKLFKSNGIEAEIPDTYNNSQKTLFFQVK
jgi:hypothetical protein